MRLDRKTRTVLTARLEMRCSCCVTRPNIINEGMPPIPSHKPVKAGPGLLGRDIDKPSGPGQVNSKLGLRRPQDASPVDGLKLWDSMEYLEDGTPLYLKGKNSCIYFCIHGAGHSALSFTLLAQELQEFAAVAAYDIRGHGNSRHAGGEADLSIQTLVADAFAVFLEVVRRNPESTFVILGHSMGGSVAARLAKQLETTPNSERVVGLLIVDVVEGTALEYLPYMVEIISHKPKQFASLEDAIKWAVQSKSVMNLSSAKISIPPQLREVKSDGGAAHFEWKNNLLTSQPFWLEWFKGLSSTFLSSKFAKVCFIAARERLDKELEIANMQGKFKLVTFPNVGHCMMEDDPVAMARNCHMVLDRFRCALCMDDVRAIRERGVPAFVTRLKPYSKN